MKEAEFSRADVLRLVSCTIPVSSRVKPAILLTSAAQRHRFESCPNYLTFLAYMLLQKYHLTELLGGNRLHNYDDCNILVIIL